MQIRLGDRDVGLLQLPQSAKDAKHNIRAIQLYEELSVEEENLFLALSVLYLIRPQIETD